jgi:DNA-binding transcriptional LysR family regulator
MVRINVQVTSRSSVLEKLAVGDIALGVSSKRIEQRYLEYRDLFTDDVILIVPADHPWSENARIHPDDLLDEPIILREKVAGTREVLFGALRQQDIYPEMLKVAMELGNAEAIVMAVEERIGVAFVSRLAAARGLELGNIREVHVEGMNLRRSISMVRNNRIPPTRAQIEFWDFVNSPEAQNKLMGKLTAAENCEIG